MKSIGAVITALPLGVSLISVAAAFDAQGHRGARGLAPENTLPGFARALEIGVTTLELDVGVSKDGHLVVSHNPRLHPAIVRTGDGRWLAGERLALRQLTLAEIKRYDVGRIDPASRNARRFPDQQPVDGTAMPTLSEVIALTRAAGNTTVRFNVETKLNPAEPDLTVGPRHFADILVAALRDGGIADRATVQSFDWRTLARVQVVAPEIPTVYLTAQQRWLDNIQKGRPGPSPWTAGHDIDAIGGSVPRLVAAAGGAVWSPYHRELDQAALDEAHGLGLQVVVWTVNRPDDMRRLIATGVDGIITDYPDRLRRVMPELNMPLPPATPPPD